MVMIGKGVLAIFLTKKASCGTFAPHEAFFVVCVKWSAVVKNARSG